jgi:lipopolysaccharide/colanic/teichoic acid biosynthesis glycosyltransferase
MGALAKIRAYGRVLLRTRYAELPDLVRLLGRRPAIMAGVAAYEAGLMASGRVDPRLKALASVKTGALVGCPF